MNVLLSAGPQLGWFHASSCDLRSCL